jgi:hypothetical protein
MDNFIDFFCNLIIIETKELVEQFEMHRIYFPVIQVRFL